MNAAVAVSAAAAKGAEFSPPCAIGSDVSVSARRSRIGGCAGTAPARQHTSAYVSQHTSAYVSIRQHTSAYVSIRQHASAYVSIRQQTSAYLLLLAELDDKWEDVIVQTHLPGLGFRV